MGYRGVHERLHVAQVPRPSGDDGERYYNRVLVWTLAAWCAFGVLWWLGDWLLNR